MDGYPKGSQGLLAPHDRLAPTLNGDGTEPPRIQRPRAGRQKRAARIGRRLEVTQLAPLDPRRHLEARRQEILKDLRQRLQEARDEWTWTNDVRDTADSSEFDCREDIGLALIRLKAETLQRIDEALLRLHHGTYGLCVDCRTRISAARLRALPFAVRCKTCEEARERSGPTNRAAQIEQRMTVIETSDWQG